MTDAGLMRTETTIGGYSQYDPDKVPEFIRMRRAMQYADDFSAEHPQWSHLDGYLKDRPTQPWALF